MSHSLPPRPSLAFPSFQHPNVPQETPLGQSSSLRRSNSYLLLRSPSETAGGLTSFGALSDSEPEDDRDYQNWVESLPGSGSKEWKGGIDSSQELDGNVETCSVQSTEALDQGSALNADGIEKQTSTVSKFKPLESTAADRQLFEGRSDFFEGNVHRLVLAEEFCRRRLQHMYQTQLKQPSFTAGYPPQLRNWWQKCLRVAEAEEANRIRSRTLEIAKTL